MSGNETHLFGKAPVLLPEDVFESWDLSTLHNYCQQNDLEYDLATLQRLLEIYDTAPLAFVSESGLVHEQSPYWLQADLDEDLKILRETTDGCKEDVEATLALQHDEMCSFLDSIVRTLADGECVQ